MPGVGQRDADNAPGGGTTTAAATKGKESGGVAGGGGGGGGGARSHVAALLEGFALIARSPYLLLMCGYLMMTYVVGGCPHGEGETNQRTRTCWEHGDDLPAAHVWVPDDDLRRGWVAAAGWVGVWVVRIQMGIQTIVEGLVQGGDDDDLRRGWVSAGGRTIKRA
jgi:hypothetical protein